MTKNPRRVRKSTRRSSSSSQHPAQEILKCRLRKSTSSGPMIGSNKRRFIKRILRRGAELDASQLLERVAPFVSNDKRMPDVNDETERSDEIDTSSIDEKVLKSPNSPHFRIHKFKPQLKTKVNNSATVKLLRFNSKRNSIVAPCFDEDSVHTQTCSKLKETYHKDVREEDNDSTDSYIQLALEKGLRSLFKAVEIRSHKSKLRNRADLDSTPTSEDPVLRLRTRMNSPRKITKPCSPSSKLMAKHRSPSGL